MAVSPTPPSPAGWLLSYAERLRFPQLLLLVGSLFVLDLFVPDLIPLVDEILLGLLTLLLGAWRRPAGPPPKPPEKDVTPPGGHPR